MKIISYNILETTSTYGLNPFVLSGAVSGYNTFSTLYKDRIYFEYYIEHDTLTEWEAGIGYLDSGSLYRILLKQGTNGFEFVNFSAGIKKLTVNSNIELDIPTGDTLITEGALINSATSKTTPIDADMIGIMDSAASNILKKLSWLNLKATLKTYFDTLYQNALTLTTTGTSGAATLVGSTLNIPQYSGGAGYDPLTAQHFFQDFAFDTSQGSTANYTFGTQGGTAQAGAVVTTTYTNAVGVARLTSGTSANYGLSLQTNPQQIGTFRPGTYAATFVGRCNMNQLSDGTNRYTTRVGLITAAYNSNPASGIFFRYTDNVNSGKYECVCRNANVETVISTTIAPAISTNWDKLEWRINAAGNSVEFFINDVSQGTITTNIPTTTYLLLWFVLHKVSGTSSQLMDIDLYYFKITRTI